MNLEVNRMIFRVNLSRQTVSKEHPSPVFYRRYMGGWGFILYYLLRELERGVDPLSPDNKLVIAPGVVTGVPVSGSGRGAIGAKSPLTGGFGAAEAGGYFSSVLKHAGCDCIIVEGQSETPLYLWVQDGELDICNAEHLWGLDTGETLDIIRKEKSSPTARAAMIGIAGENLVRISCIMDGERDAYARTGLGAVMGSKKLKAIAAHGSSRINVADPNLLSSLSQEIVKKLREKPPQLHLLGTGADLTGGAHIGNLPVCNFRDGNFQNATRISSMHWKEQGELIGMDGCYACAVRCKTVVKIDKPWKVDARYGGPEYETDAALGSCCGVDDERALFKANELCNRYGLDTIGTGVTIAFAMECYENGIINKEDTGGIELRFGNSEAVVRLVDAIAKREGIGDLLAEGSRRAALRFGGDALKYSVQVKGQEVPMHEPRLQRGVGVGYCVSPTGAEHTVNINDLSLSNERGLDNQVRPFGILEPFQVEDIGARKILALVYRSQFVAMMNCIGFCFLLWLTGLVTSEKLNNIVHAVTGWNTSVLELMNVGRRVLTMARVFNMREGFTAEDDWLPQRLFTPTTSGPLSNRTLDPVDLKKAIRIYYETMGWDKENGVPTRTTLEQLDIGWAYEYLTAP